MTRLIPPGSHANIAHYADGSAGGMVEYPREDHGPLAVGMFGLPSIEPGMA
jgi:hypothetical protein